MVMPTAPDDVAVLVPVKAFGSAKTRLASAVGPQERRALARRLAEGVLDAACGATPFVVCEDDEVRTWAEARGVGTIVLPAAGLNRALQHARNRVVSEGFGRVVVAHGDLVHPYGLLQATGAGDELVLVPDRRQQGTNVLSLPGQDRRAAAFRFCYGPGSFARHLRRGRELGLPTSVLGPNDLADDLDEPGELHALPTALANEIGLAAALEQRGAHRFG